MNSTLTTQACSKSRTAPAGPCCQSPTGHQAEARDPRTLVVRPAQIQELRDSDA